MRRITPPALLALVLTGSAALAQPVPCGGDFTAFLSDMQDEAEAEGVPSEAAQRFFSALSRDPSVIAADQRQGIFQAPFIEFSQRLISSNRLERGRQMLDRHAEIFDRIARDYGISHGILLAFWAFETDYGQIQGDYNTANALATLSHDCRRPELFQPQLIAAARLHARGDLPLDTTGAWAGEIGMVQMLPEDILENGIDGDGDGHVTLKTSAPDALMSGAAMLSDLGWRAGEPWLEEVQMPAEFDWYLTGLETQRPASDWAAMGVSARDGQIDAPDLPASILLPQGRGGPAFLAYPNFSVLFEWNKSFTYVLTAAYFGTRLEGAPALDTGNPAPGLGPDEMVRLQEKLQDRGYDVGEADGILGAGTRSAVRDVQRELGLPADAWPTAELLNRL
ncbi:lytic transglycosylase [Roseivivax halodurans JCM 10272]|uniref:Lytic transglycosylase n=1 Tax=Roseivivax halodurans JCM 10272 TaxID=1449350 RepID=X7EHH8_9RHOB|nr:lytic murein transglycosylase [Roseivivax halodurans]ETX15362.1 lytic transglycosylase [Roseivivax halodurans JCM 10272]